MKLIIFILSFIATPLLSSNFQQEAFDEMTFYFPTNSDNQEDETYNISLSNQVIMSFLIEPIFRADTFTNHEKRIHERIIESLFKTLDHQKKNKRFLILTDIQKEQRRFIRILRTRERILRKRQSANMIRNQDVPFPLVRENAFRYIFPQIFGARRDREEENTNGNNRISRSLTPTEVLDQDVLTQDSADFSYLSSIEHNASSSSSSNSSNSSASYSTISYNDHE
ncbi:MAG: hypothetical protein WC747_03335 [Candidatus Babeliales bacterium]|jgi:hypothetical protein